MWPSASVPKLAKARLKVLTDWLVRLGAVLQSKGDFRRVSFRRHFQYFQVTTFLNYKLLHWWSMTLTFNSVRTSILFFQWIIWFSWDKKKLLEWKEYNVYSINKFCREIVKTDIRVLRLAEVVLKLLFIQTKWME